MFKKTVLVLIFSMMILCTLSMGSRAQALQGTDLTGDITGGSGCILIGIPGNACPAHVIPFTIPAAGSNIFTYQPHSCSGDLCSFVVVDPYDPTVDILSQDTQGPGSHIQLPNYGCITSMRWL